MYKRVKKYCKHYRHGIILAMQVNKQMTLYCFSPLVMLATFLIEISFAFYVIWRYKMTSITRLVTSILVCLATFQGAEYLLCGGMGVDGGTWSRLGYVSISLLPPLGLHLAHAIAGNPSRYLVPFAYLTGAAFIGYFALGTQAISGHTCYANYAVFNTQSGLSWLYALYYYGWLAIGTFTAYNFAQLSKKHIKRALYALSVGYLSFIVPTTVINLIDPSTISGIPSIMCGFAVIFAFILVQRVAPESLIQKNQRTVLRIRLPF